VPSLTDALDRLPRARLATLPTPLEEGPVLPGGARLWVKRDDLTGLGMGGNKARKLEFLCGAAAAEGADTLVTVGAGQSNHCRMAAAAGAVLGMPVHLVLGGSPPREPAGNLLLDILFGAALHFPGTERWDELEAAAAALASKLRAEGRRPSVMPIGGSTPVGACGFAAAADELTGQCAARGIAPTVVVHTTSSGGTHAGLLAGFAALRAEGQQVPRVMAIGVAKGVALDAGHATGLARACLQHLGLAADLVAAGDAAVDARFLGADYGVPTEAADEAIRWAARNGGWVFDRVYTGKGFAGLLGLAREGRFAPGDELVFWHTGGQPAVFAPGGAPAPGPS
jgi:1-aminocyclopropane-1-carboxylate deaminase/D-cysteine desulfhydrase-like pyridoxal-dependent ACC family enzyme